MNVNVDGNVITTGEIAFVVVVDIQFITSHFCFHESDQVFSRLHDYFLNGVFLKNQVHIVFQIDAVKGGKLPLFLYYISRSLETVAGISLSAFPIRHDDHRDEGNASENVEGAFHVFKISSLHRIQNIRPGQNVS